MLLLVLVSNIVNDGTDADVTNFFRFLLGITDKDDDDDGASDDDDDDDDDGAIDDDDAVAAIILISS